jgi:hypothetical protein
MLAVCIHEYETVAMSGSRSGFDGRAISKGYRMPNNHRPGLACQAPGAIRRTVVDNDDLGIRIGSPGFAYNRGYCRRLVPGGNNDGQ